MTKASEVTPRTAAASATLTFSVESDGSISQVSGGPLDAPVATGPFWDQVEAWRDGYRAGLLAEAGLDTAEPERLLRALVEAIEAEWELSEERTMQYDDSRATETHRATISAADEARAYLRQKETA
jgi:hypothetical protein